MWIEATCCFCNTPNLIDNGECQSTRCGRMSGFPRDMTIGDVEGFVCWKCNADNEFDECGETEESPDCQIDQGYPVPQSPDPAKAFNQGA